MECDICLSSLEEEYSQYDLTNGGVMNVCSDCGLEQADISDWLSEHGVQYACIRPDCLEPKSRFDIYCFHHGVIALSKVIGTTD